MYTFYICTLCHSSHSLTLLWSTLNVAGTTEELRYWLYLSWATVPALDSRGTSLLVTGVVLSLSYELLDLICYF